MAIKISEKQLVSLIANSINQVLNVLKSDPEFVVPSDDREILSKEKQNDKEILSKKKKEQQGVDILLTD